MANKYDYLTEYRQFFEEFANTVEPNDQLPVKLGSYKFINSEVVGGIVDWCLQYLTRKSCPSTLIGPLIKITIDEIRIACKKHPIACGFNPSENVYEPLKLMQTVMSKMNEVCLRYLDNSQLDTLPTPPLTTPPKISMCASRNTRRRMEDRHVVIHDINSMFNIQDTSPASYYAIFDGHAGSDAAAYSAAHLHQFLVESEFYPSDPEKSLKEAFLRTDEFFLEKSKIENFRSGTTAVCALYKPKEETLYVAWVGDSQALLVNRGKVLQIVKPHKPCREDEKDRIEANGGCVMFWGMWRVNGQLAVSRAIGDIKLKPYVTAEPDIVAVPLDGNEEFLIMACDGLWDFVSEDDAAIAVYKKIKENPENIEGIAESLSDLAKQEGSRDNISVIVIFLKDPVKIAKKLSADWSWTAKPSTDNMEDVNNASNNQFDLFDVFQKRGLDPFDQTDFKPNGNENKTSDLFMFDRPANGKRHADDFDDDDDDDMGPETNVDEELSPIIEGKKLGNLNEACEKMDTLDVDLELQRQQTSEFEPLREPREETPTPPADTVLDSSGLAENVAESEDSEDEWNYYKVDPKQKENSLPPVETNNEVSPTDEMSQLNPDAKEFVPVSPTRVAGSPFSPVSPVGAIPRDLVDDTLIAQSPRRAVPMDISVPSPGEFQIEVKQRPSELFDDEFDEKAEQNGHTLSTQEIMQNLLNGKDVSEIEFHPQNFICDKQNQTETDNNKENTTPSEENPTESSLSPTRDDSDFAGFVPKPQDPMMDSFYQDKEETGFSTNPFDLNKVQVLPDDVDDFLQPVSQSEEPISPAQSPLGVPLADTPVQSEEQVDLLNEIVENIVPNNVEESKSLLDFAKSPELTSPIPDMENKSLVELANSPIPSLPEPELPEICEIANTPDIKSPEPEISKSPDVCNIAKSPEVCNIAKSPEVCNIAKSSEVCEIAKSPALAESPVCEIPKSPEPVKSPEITVHSPEPEMSPVCEIAKSPLLEAAKSPVPEVIEQSPVPEITHSPFAEVLVKSPVPEVSPVCEIAKSPLLETAKSPVPEVIQQSPVPEITHSPFAEVIAKSPVPDVSQSPLPVQEVLEVQTPVEHSPLGPLSPKSPIPELTGLVSPDITASIKDENISGEISDAKSPEPAVHELEQEAKSPEIPDIVSPVPEVAQNVEQTLTELVEQTTDLINKVGDDIQMKIDSAIADTKVEDLISDAIQDIVENKPETPIIETPEVTTEVCQQVTNISLISSEVPSINSFLERSVVPEVTSPLSPTEEVEKFQTEPPENWKQNVEIKCDIIKPEFAVHTLASPSEESKGTDTPPPTPAVVLTEPEEKRESPEPLPVVEIVKPEVVEVKKEAVEVKKEAAKTTKTTAKSLATKKPLSKTSPTSPSKPLPSKTTSTTSTIKKTSTTPLKSTLPAKPKPSTTPTASPRTSTTRTTPKPLEKKPLTNGDVKPAVKSTLVKRTSTTTKTTPSAISATAEKKPSPIKPPSTTRPSSTGAAKPPSATRTTSATTKPVTSASAAPATRRPASLTAKTSAPAVATKTAPSRPATAGTLKSTTTTAKPRVPSTSTAPKPRVASTLASKPATKTADSEKEKKETVNKQLSASRTASRTTTAKTTTLAARKVDVKTSTTARTTTRTTTTTVKSATKKPEVTKTTVTKTRTTTAITKPVPEQNGVVSVVQEITTVVSEDPQLVKDNSPIEIDNSKLTEIIAD